MNALVLNPPKKRLTFVIQLLITAIVGQYLFYIDEGFNDFRWMKDFGNWIVYVIYVGLFFIGQLIATKWLFKNEYNWYESIVIGITGILLDIGIIMVIALVVRLITLMF